MNIWEGKKEKETNIALDLKKGGKLGGIYFPEKIENVSAVVPSRSLKPKDLLASLAASKKDFEDEQKLLEESLQIEEVIICCCFCFCCFLLFIYCLIGIFPALFVCVYFLPFVIFSLCFLVIIVYLVIHYARLFFPL